MLVSINYCHYCTSSKAAGNYDHNRDKAHLLVAEQCGMRPIKLLHQLTCALLENLYNSVRVLSALHVSLSAFENIMTATI